MDQTATTEFTCNGAKCTKQYAGGTRKVLNLALAQRDHTKWGSSAEEFKLRGLADYHSNFIGFAEMAERNDVDGERMNRNCPAKELAVYLGTQFFKQFNKEDWKLSPSQSSIQFGGSTPFVDAFRLYPSATACAYSCTTFDVPCKVAAAKCSTCQTYVCKLPYLPVQLPVVGWPMPLEVCRLQSFAAALQRLLATAYAHSHTPLITVVVNTESTTQHIYCCICTNSNASKPNKINISVLT